MDTKENILMTALRLFARDGYEAVSVSMIAGELGITKGALYRHYSSKRDIFDHIVARMYEIDAQRARQYSVPEERWEDMPAAYEDVSWESVLRFTEAQFVFWTEDDFACRFRRMLALEQYRNAEMSELYKNCLTTGPVSYMEDIFLRMMDSGLIARDDPKLLALSFYAPLFLLIQMSDSESQQKTYAALLEQYIRRFRQSCTAKTAERTDRK